MATQMISEVMRRLDLRAPSATAESWDNVGLLAGDPQWRTAGATVSIDLTADAILAAERRGHRLIINHHPCIFPKSRGLSQVVAGAGSSDLVFQALKRGIAIAAFHTNFDRCALEVVELVARGLGAVAQGRLQDSGSGELLKLIVFVPINQLERVREAVCAAGAGHIGNYDSCTFSTAGEGTFRGGSGTTPFIGAPGRLERTQEVRLETVFPRGLRAQVVAALIQSHPYEEVAYDLYPVAQSAGTKGLIRGSGYGFWGDFPESKPFAEVVKDVRRLFNVKGFLLTGLSRFPCGSDLKKSPAGKGKKFRRVGFAAGKGASFVESANSVGCDLFITGEVGYHGALNGSRSMTILELGHRESERYFLLTMKNWLIKQGLQAIELNVPTQIFYSHK